MLNRETFLFFLQKATGQSYFKKPNGAIDFTNEPKWLKQSPNGWFENVLTFARNSHYWGLNRSFTNQYSFYKDAQEIIRSLVYQKSGLKDPLNLVVNKFNPLTGQYDPYYKGDIDLPHIEDDPIDSLKATVIEGGLQKLIKSYENTVFEIPCDGSIQENISVRIDGYKFKTQLDYLTVPFTGTGDAGIIIPMVLNNPDAYDYGVLKGDQKYEAIDPNNYASNLAKNKNYTLSSIRQIIVNVSGIINNESNLINANLFLYTSFGVKIDLVPIGNMGAGQYAFDQNVTINPGENLFLLMTTQGGTIALGSSTIYFTYNSKLQNTYCYVIRPYDLLSLLLKKICETAKPVQPIYYDIQSSLLKQNANLCLTSSMALRNEKNAVIKTKLSDFYDAFDAVLAASMGVQSGPDRRQQLFFERLGYTLNSGNIDMDVKEVFDFVFSPAQDLFFDTVIVGYAEKNYDDKRGYQEVNTTLKFKAPFTPFTSTQKEFKKVSPYRSDMFGVEDARKLVNSGTGNNKSDNDVFFLNTDLSKTDNTSVEINSLASSGNIRSLNNLPPLNQISYSDIQGTGIALNFQIATLNSTNDIIRYNGNGVSIKLLAQISGIYQPTTYAYHTGIGFLGSWYDYSYPQVPVYIRLMKNNTVLDTAYVLLSEQKPFSYSFNASINLVFGDYFYIDITPVDTTQPFLYNCFRATASANMTIQTNSAEIYGLKRGVYDAISGIDNGTTAYNIEDLTPKQMLLNHGDYIRSILWNYTQYSLTYLTTDKNHNLSITKNGATITECTDVPIGSLNPNLLFLPYYIKYKTKVPVNFKDILDNAANGHIQNSYIGINAYGYPMEVKQKPAIDESQEWKLLCSPKTSIDDILNIQFNAINTVQLMALGAYFSLLNSTKWYPWTLTKSDQYNFIHMDEDVQSEQTAHLLHPAQYIQKWQQNDTIRIQCITTNLAPVTIEIYNIETGLLAASFSLPQVTNQAVTSQYALFEGGYALTTLPEGIYQMKAIIGIGATQVMFKSEPMHVAEKWPNTMLFKYTDSRNKWTTIFTTGFAPEFRIEAKLGKFNTESRFSQFENQPADIETVNGIPYRTFILQIGWRSNGVPPWARELLEFILLLETCTVDGLRITRSNEAKFEEEEISGWPMSNWKIKVRQSINKFGVSQTTDGVINDQMLVTYPVNTLLFGDGNTDNTITVTDYQ